jgi:hypothetical protein
MDAAGIGPVTSRWKASTWATKQQGVVDIEGMIFPFGWTCYVWILTELATQQTSQADVCKVCKPCLRTWCHQAGVFFLSSGPKNALLSLTVSVIFFVVQRHLVRCYSTRQA